MKNEYKIPDTCFACSANPYCPKDVEPESHACKIHRAWEEKLEKCPECGEQMFEPPPGIKIIKAQRALIDELKKNLVEQTTADDSYEKIWNSLKEHLNKSFENDCKGIALMSAPLDPRTVIHTILGEMEDLEKWRHISDVKYFDHVLTPEEILEEYKKIDKEKEEKS
jgi:Rad3-related DNA helicase